MIDWLRRGILTEPVPDTVEIGGRPLALALRRHARATRLTMRLAPDGSEVRITLPRWGRTADALMFVDSRRDWLERQLAAVPHPAPALPGGTLLYRGHPHRIDWNARLPRTPLLHDSTVRLGGAENAVSARLLRWLEGEAMRLLGEDLDFYSRRASVPRPSLSLSRAQRRWGSCSKAGGQRGNSAGAVRINWRLVQAPDAVRRSVVAHEVAHLVHFDHSPDFHALLGRLYDDDLPAADCWLRQQGRTLYAAFG